MSDLSLHITAEERSKIYWFLSQFYLMRPAEQFIAELRQWCAGAGENRSGEQGLRQGVELLHNALQESDHHQLCARLLQEYTRLFRGIKEGYGLPPPYESVYRESRLMGESTATVVRKYAQAGYAAIDPETGPQDHIGVELKFMSLLCYDEGVAWQRGDASAAVQSWQWQERFLDEHLLLWVPTYCSRVQENSVEPFYQSAALLTKQTVTRDRQVLSALRQAFATANP